MKEHMIGFHRWMLKNDTEENAERFFHYTDEDMVEEYLREIADVCEYSGLRPVEGYKEEEVIKEFDKPLIVDLDTEEGEKLAEAYKRGYADGYHQDIPVYERSDNTTIEDIVRLTEELSKVDNRIKELEKKRSNSIMDIRLK